MKEVDLWVIDDDKYRFKLLKDELEENNINIKIRQFDILYDAFQASGSPDFILIDTSSIAGKFSMFANKKTLVSLSHRFADEHKSSNFCFICAVKSWANELAGDIYEMFDKEIIFEVVEDTEEVIDWLKKYKGGIV